MTGEKAVDSERAAARTRIVTFKVTHGHPSYRTQKRIGRGILFIVISMTRI